GRGLSSLDRDAVEHLVLQGRGLGLPFVPARQDGGVRGPLDHPARDLLLVGVGHLAAACAGRGGGRILTPGLTLRDHLVELDLALLGDLRRLELAHDRGGRANRSPPGDLLLRIERVAETGDRIDDRDPGLDAVRADAILFAPRASLAVPVDAARRLADDAVAVGERLGPFDQRLRRVGRAFHRLLERHPRRDIALGVARAFVLGKGGRADHQYCERCGCYTHTSVSIFNNAGPEGPAYRCQVLSSRLAPRASRLAPARLAPRASRLAPRASRLAPR